MSLFEYYMKALTDKNGKAILPILEDMRMRENALLICSFGGDDPYAPISNHLLNHHESQVLTGIKHFAEAGNCCEVILYAGDLDLFDLPEKLSTSTHLTVTVEKGPTSPVLREPTALYKIIDTGTIRSGNAEEDYIRTFPTYGYQGRPTLIVDAETAYQAGRLFEFPGEQITKHIVVTDEQVQIEELPVGTALGSLLDGHNEPHCVLLGGLWGSFLGTDDMKEMKLQFHWHHDSVLLLGSGDCVVNQTAELYKSIRDYSCQKCVLCREGSWQLAAIFNDMTEGKAVRDDIALIEDICPLIETGAMCMFGKNMVKPALTAVALCRDEVTDHIVARNCAAGQCRGLVSYLIDPALCSGCGDCLEVCPEEAVEGEDGYIHMIDQKLCNKCGKCVASCPEGAIKAGEKIKVPKKLTMVGKFR